MPEGQMERCTTLTCRQCGKSFTPKNRNGIKTESCSRKCTIAWHNARRLKGAALLKDEKSPRRRGPSRHAQRVSQVVFQSLVPVDQRAALIRQACAHLGITDPAAIDAALKRNGCEVAA